MYGLHGCIRSKAPQPYTALQAVHKKQASVPRQQYARALTPGMTRWIVSDNALIQLMVMRLLTRHGHRVTVVSDGKDALAQLRANRCDAVRMDLQIPSVSGLVVVRQWRAEERTAACRSSRSVPGRPRRSVPHAWRRAWMTSSPSRWTGASFLRCLTGSGRARRRTAGAWLPEAPARCRARPRRFDRLPMAPLSCRRPFAPVCRPRQPGAP